MPDRDYTDDARTLTLDHIDDLADISPTTIAEAFPGELDEDDIEAIAERVKDFAYYLKAAVDAYAPEGTS